MKVSLMLPLMLGAVLVSQRTPPSSTIPAQGAVAELEDKASKSHMVQGTPSDATKGKKTTLDDLSTTMANLERQVLVVQDDATKHFLQEQIDSVKRQQAARAALTPRIAQGFRAQLSDFPFQVSIQLAAVAKPRTAHFCGGVLIAPTWVLSGAHCFAETPFNPQLLKQDVKIFAGSADLTKPRTRFTVKQLIRHPDYNPKTQDNDIAILELDNPVPNQTPVQPLLDTNSALIAAGQKAIVIGWGDTYAGSGHGSDQLLFALIEVVDTHTCNGEDSYNGAITPNMICAGTGKGDACQGDSGGPMVVSMPDSSYRLAGIISWGKGCNIPQYPGVYTRVPSYVPWIHDVTKLELVPGHQP